jgi:hypothetical protein
MKIVFQDYSKKEIKRRKYQELTSDIRKQHRKEIKLDDFRAKKTQERNSNKSS